MISWFFKLFLLYWAKNPDTYYTYPTTLHMHFSLTTLKHFGFRVRVRSPPLSLPP